MKTSSEAFGREPDKPGPRTDLFARWGQIETGNEALKLYEAKRKRKFEGRKFTLEDAFDEIANKPGPRLRPRTVKKYYYLAKAHRAQLEKLEKLRGIIPDSSWQSGLSEDDLEQWAATVTPIKRRRRRRSRLRRLP